MSFAPGQVVRVSARAHEGHHRTPAYLKGRRGTIVRGHGAFRNPETRAYGDDGTPRHNLYLVQFEQSELWLGYERPTDSLRTDVFEHWLEEDV